jgi:hypothetical protein
VPGRDEHARLVAAISPHLHAGWTVADLVATLDGRWTGVDDRVAVLTYRVRQVGDPPEKHDERASPVVEEWCGACNEEGRWIYDPDGNRIFCPDCNPKARKAHP